MGNIVEGNPLSASNIISRFADADDRLANAIADWQVSAEAANRMAVELDACKRILDGIEAELLPQASGSNAEARKASLVSMLQGHASYQEALRMQSSLMDDKKCAEKDRDLAMHHISRYKRHLDLWAGLSRQAVE